MAKNRHKPVHKRVDGVNYIIYANGDVRQDRRGGRRPGSGRKSLAPENKGYHALKLSAKSSLILSALSEKLSNHSEHKVTKLDVISLIIHKATLSKAWMGKASKVASLVTKGEDFIRIRRTDYEKIMDLKIELLRIYNLKVTTTKLFNCLIYLFGSQGKSTLV